MCIRLRWGRGASIRWNQSDGPRSRGSTRTSSGLSARYSYPSTARQNGITSALTSASIETWTVWSWAGSAAKPSSRATAENCRATSRSRPLRP